MKDRLGNATEQCSEHCSSIEIEQCVEYIHGRTDVTDGLTKKVVPFENESSVSNAREFGSDFTRSRGKLTANRCAVAS